jgi:hypothetical protein
MTFVETKPCEEKARYSRGVAGFSLQVLPKEGMRRASTWSKAGTTNAAPDGGRPDGKAKYGD